MSRYRIFAAAALAGCVAIVNASGLVIGDKAPPIKVSKWVQGDPITSGTGGLRVVDFWATWCQPCKESIPHLTDLSKKYQGKVTFIGVDVFERSADDVATVKAFVKAMGPKMGYKVAVDNAEGTMSKTWMIAANQNTIPTAFILDEKGEVAWIGHPMGMEAVLDQMVAGKYDLAKAKADFLADQQKATAEQAARSDISKRVMEAQADYKAGKKADALAILNSVETSHPQFKNQMEVAKFMVLVADDKTSASAIVEQAATDAGKQASYAYLQFGIIACRPPTASKEDLTFATGLADKALAKDPTDPIVSFEAASIYHRGGNSAKAISLDQDALKYLGNAKPEIQDSLKKAIEKKLFEFQGKPRTP